MFNMFIEKTILLAIIALIFSNFYLAAPKSEVAYNSKNLKTVNEAVVSALRSSKQIGHD
jgi:hypothetical protein